jgi:hypothetical protein
LAHYHFHADVVSDVPLKLGGIQPEIAIFIRQVVKGMVGDEHQPLGAVPVKDLEWRKKRASCHLEQESDCGLARLPMKRRRMQCRDLTVFNPAGRVDRAMQFAEKGATVLH